VDLGTELPALAGAGFDGAGCFAAGAFAGLGEEVAPLFEALVVGAGDDADVDVEVLGVLGGTSVLRRKILGSTMIATRTRIAANSGST
jgi:hypothetical protein